MGSEVRPDLIVYVDHSDVELEKVVELEAGIHRVVAFIEAHEPQLIAYGFHLDERRGRMTVTAVHPDSASLELHLEVGHDQFRTLAGLITLTQVEVYGTVSDHVRELLEQKAAMLGGAGVRIVERFDGFARLP